MFGANKNSCRVRKYRAAILERYLLFGLVHEYAGILVYIDELVLEVVEHPELSFGVPLDDDGTLYSAGNGTIAVYRVYGVYEVDAIPAQRRGLGAGYVHGLFLGSGEGYRLLGHQLACFVELRYQVKLCRLGWRNAGIHKAFIEEYSILCRGGRALALAEG